MTDPRRLVDEGADDFEVRLLRAARRDALSLGGRRRILAGLGFGGVITATLAASTAEAGVRGWASSLGALRWVAGGSVSALAVWAGVQALSPAPVVKPPSGQVHAVVPARLETADVSGAAEPSSAPPVVEQAAAPSQIEKGTLAKAVPTPRVERAQDSLQAELSALDQARAALSRRDAAGALRLLDDYAHRFPKRRLDTEATVLRIEALVARGDRTAAARLGKEFLARQPNGPYARRVSSLVADPTRAAKAEP
jgi:hypothetical protein